MNTELQIFKNEEFGEVRTVEKQITNRYLGFFYFLEWDNRIKIGCSTKPYTRLMSLKRTAEKYGNVETGRFALSQSHTLTTYHLKATPSRWRY